MQHCWWNLHYTLGGRGQVDSLPCNGSLQTHTSYLAEGHLVYIGESSGDGLGWRKGDRISVCKASTKSLLAYPLKLDKSPPSHKCTWPFRDICGPRTSRLWTCFFRGPITAPNCRFSTCIAGFRTRRTSVFSRFNVSLLALQLPPDIAPELQRLPWSMVEKRNRAGCHLHIGDTQLHVPGPPPSQ